VSFVLLMALREIRASWKRLLFFFVCIAIGVGSIVALRSVIQNVRAALARETRTLIASDILLTSNSPLQPDVRDIVAREVSAGRVSQTTDAVEIATMVRPADGRPVARMVELRAVQAEFPFYGTLTLRDGA
jgi:putative ABC transport system permease protein